MKRFENNAARLIWEGRPNKAARRTLPINLHRKAAELMDRVLNTATLRDCYNYPPGWRFKQLHGKLRKTYRIDDQYRIRFRWDPRHGAAGITLGEFHGED